MKGVDGPAGRLAGTDAEVTRLRTGIEGSHGFTLWDRASLTPGIGFGTSQTGRGYRLGYSLGVLRQEGLDLELGLDAQRRESPINRSGPDHSVLARATLRW